MNYPVASLWALNEKYGRISLRSKLRGMDPRGIQFLRKTCGQTQLQILTGIKQRQTSSERPGYLSATWDEPLLGPMTFDLGDFGWITIGAERFDTEDPVGRRDHTSCLTPYDYDPG